jgi:hypothetical protein
MAESIYEKYIVRQPTRSKHRVSLAAWSTVENARTAPPYIFADAGKPIAGVNHMVEFMWIWKDTAMGATAEKPPHKHNVEENFLFLSTNRDDTNDLGADIEFWLGEGKESDKLNFNTSSYIHVPANLLHMPIIYRNVKKPILLVIFAPEAGDLRSKVINYPVRGV